jgi:16S rRNA (guanine527-N7)-methyltransferase
MFHVEHFIMSDNFNISTNRKHLALQLSSWTRRINIHLKKTQTAQLLELAELIFHENQKVRLTGTEDLSEIVRKHIVDSLTPVPVIKKRGDARVIDIGSGAGLPGLVLKIALPDISAVLLDSNKKKCEFLESAVSHLHLRDVKVFRERAETAGRNISCRELFNIVVCRAVSHLSVVVEYALPFLSQGGLFIAYKGSSAEKECREASSAITKIGGRLSGIKTFILPEGGETRMLVLIDKITTSPDEYPRRAGIPRKRPVKS